MYHGMFSGHIPTIFCQVQYTGTCVERINWSIRHSEVGQIRSADKAFYGMTGSSKRTVTPLQTRVLYKFLKLFFLIKVYTAENVKMM